MLSVGLEGKAALHRWIDGLQQVVADLELAEEMEQELLVAHRDAVAEAAVEAAAAASARVTYDDAVETDATEALTNFQLAVMKANEAVALLPSSVATVSERTEGAVLDVDTAEEAVVLLELAVHLLYADDSSARQPQQQWQQNLATLITARDIVLDTLQASALRLLSNDDGNSGLQGYRGYQNAAVLFQLVTRLASTSVETGDDRTASSTAVLAERLNTARCGVEQAQKACTLYRGLVQTVVETRDGDTAPNETDEMVALLPPADAHEKGATAPAAGVSTGSTSGTSHHTAGLASRPTRRNRLRVVSTTLVQDSVAIDSAPRAVLHAGDTVEVHGVALDHKGKLRYRVSVSRPEGEGRQCSATTPAGEQDGWISEEAAGGQKLVRGLPKHGRRGIQGMANLVRGVSSRLLGRNVENESNPDNQSQDEDSDEGMDDIEAELDAMLATPPAGSPEEVVVDVSEAAAAVAARRKLEGSNGCCVSLCHAICGWMLALGAIAGTISGTIVVANAGGPHFLALLLCSAAGFSAWFTWLVLPPIRGFAMRLTALTTFLGFLITSGMLVLLAVDVATYQPVGADGSGNTRSSGTLQGFAGVTPSTLLLVWKPLYWLSSLLGVGFTFVVYYLTSGYLTHSARLKATASKLVWMKIYAVVVGIVILGVLLYVGEVKTAAKASLLVELLQVVLVSTYMILQTVCMGAGLVSIPRHLFVGNLRQHNQFLEQQCTDKQQAWRQSTENYYCCWEAAETTRLQLSRDDPHRALMGLLTYDEFALARYVATVDLGSQSASPAVRASRSRRSFSTQSGESRDGPITTDTEGRRSLSPVVPRGDRGRFRMVSCDFGRLSVLEAAVDARQNTALSQIETLESQKLELSAELAELQTKPAPLSQAAAAEHAARVRHLEDRLTALAKERDAARQGSQLVWKKHTELAHRRMALEHAKHSMDQLAEDVVDIELALDWANSRTPFHYAQWRCWRCALGFGASVASLAVFLSCVLGTHATRRWASPLGYFVLLNNGASPAWRLFASALSLLYMGLATYSTLFGLRYRLLLVYPLRMKHNSLPASVQTLATYMLALLNPLSLWFTRIMVDQSREGHDLDTPQPAEPEHMAYSQVPTRSTRISFFLCVCVCVCGGGGGASNQVIH